MPRDGSGVYSLPAGTEAESGATILSTPYNAFLADIEAALNDLNNGTTFWTGAFKAYAGTVSAPGLSFNNDTNTGFYRIGADNIGVALGGVKFLDLSGNVLEVSSADAGASAGPVLELYRDSASPAAADAIGAVYFEGEDDGGNRTTYASIETTLDDPTDASEDATLLLKAMLAGTLTTVLSMTGAHASFSGTVSGTIGLQAAVTTTGGTAVEFTSIPSWVNEIVVTLVNVSTNGSSNLLLQIGDSGGYETSGYNSAATYLANGAAVVVGTANNGYLLTAANAAGEAVYGRLVLTRHSGNAWIISGKTHDTSSTPDLNECSGSKGLSDTLDRVRITTAGGSDTFDAMSMAISWRG